MLINTSAIHSPPVMSRYYFDYPKADYQGMCSYLLDFTFNDILLSDDVEVVWPCINTCIFLNAKSLFVPKVRFHSRQQPKW